MIARISGLLAAVFFAVPAWADIDIQEVTSPGGIEAWLVEDPSIPFVAIEIWFGGGASLDEPDKRGATNMMMALLDEGAGDLDSGGFAEATEALAASFSFDAYGDVAAVSAQMLTQNRDEAALLLRSALMEPTFDQGAINRVRAQILAVIEADAQDPNEIAWQTYNAMAFGDHPYASSTTGTPESVNAITRDDLVVAHRNVLTRGHVSVAAAGDISAEELGALIDLILGDLPAEGAPLPERADLLLGGGKTLVEFPSPQSVVAFGQDGIARDDPDFFPAFVLNEIMGGGGFGSRLMDEIRVDRGLTYGIWTFLTLDDYRQMLFGQFSSSNELVAEAVEVVKAQWAEIAENGVTDAELDAAIRYLTGAYPLRFDGNSAIAGIMVAMQHDNMPADYIVTRNDRVAAVTVDDISRVAERLLQPDALHFVIVGQPEGLEVAN